MPEKASSLILEVGRNTVMRRYTTQSGRLVLYLIDSATCPPEMISPVIYQQMSENFAQCSTVRLSQFGAAKLTSKSQE